MTIVHVHQMTITTQVIIKLFTFSAPMNAHALAITPSGQKTKIKLNEINIECFNLSDINLNFAFFVQLHLLQLNIIAMLYNLACIICT